MGLCGDLRINNKDQVVVPLRQEPCTAAASPYIRSNGARMIESG
ncbi:hypothetical protein ARSEF1564_001972 [Beauveria bassiana]